MKKIFIWIVIVTCSLPAFLIFFVGESPQLANERMVNKPLLIKEGKFNKQVFVDFTDYIGKRFVFRQDLITMNSLLISKTFDFSPVDDVIIGKDGWLFYSKTENDYLHNNTLSDDDIEKIAHTLKEMQTTCYEQGIEFLFVIAPNKNSIYAQYMPYLGDKVLTDKNSDKLFKALDEKKVPYVNLFNALKNQDMPVYHKLDTHWNNMGAAIASDQILKALNHDQLNFSSNEYTLSQNFDGDLYKMLYPKGKKKDYNVDFVNQFSFNLDKPIKNSEQVEIKTTNESRSGSVLVFRDSFGNALYPFIAESYKHGVFSRKTPYSTETITGYNKDHPLDTVIIVMAERNISDFKKFFKVSD